MVFLQRAGLTTTINSHKEPTQGPSNVERDKSGQTHRPQSTAG